MLPDVEYNEEDELLTLVGAGLECDSCGDKGELVLKSKEAVDLAKDMLVKVLDKKQALAFTQRLLKSIR